MVNDYPYKDLSGIAFTGVSIALRGDGNGAKAVIAKNVDDLLLTHNCFSGPVILNSSRYASSGDLLSIDYIPSLTAEGIMHDLKALASGNKKLFITVLSEYLNDAGGQSEAVLPKRFLERLCARSAIDPALKISQLPLSAMKAIVALLKQDSFGISGTGGYNTAMATSGGVSLEEVDIRTLESKKFPGLFFAGEALDVDGDTGGYNLQFAFSSGNLAAT
jgi:predicted Rossmann fold flavoprotein